MKHLKVRATWNETSKTVSVEIVEQTHTGNEFGNTSPNVNHEGWSGLTTTSFGYGDVCLVSHPACYGELYKPRAHGFGSSTNYSHWFIVNNYKSASGIILMSLSDWKIVKEAIIEYNKWGATQ